MTAPVASFEPVLMTPDLVDRAAEVAARAFFDDPIGAHWVPNETNRLRRLTSFFRLTLKHCLRYGDVYTVPETADGTAIWGRPGESMFSFWRSLRSGLFVSPFFLGWHGLRNFLIMGPDLDRVHDQVVPMPHWYLLLLCTDPVKQGRGIASTLMRPVLEQADRDGTPCYLETMTEKNVAFYQRRGFDVAWKGNLPRQGPPIWAMLRRPR